MGTFIFVFSLSTALFLIAGMLNLMRKGKIVWPEAPLDDPNPPAIDRATNATRFWIVIALGFGSAVALLIAAYFEGMTIFR